MLGIGPGRIRTLVSTATDSSHRLTMGKHKRNRLLPNHKCPELSYFVCSNVYSPLYKSCQACPWGTYGPHPGGVMGKT